MDMDYQWIVIGALFRLALWFFLLYGALALVFLSDLSSRSLEDRIFYAWTGLNGPIIVTVFCLIQLKLYDFIGLVFCALVFLVVRMFWRRREEGVLNVLYAIERRLVLRIIKLIERIKLIGWQWVKSGLSKRPKPIPELKRRSLVAAILLAGGLTRLIPSFQHAAPFTRSWYFDLATIKDLPWQIYFGDYPDPAGMHVLVGLFSTLTQVSPELILHLLGGIISTLACMLVYWTIREFTPRSRAAPLLGMALYALVPTLVMPVSLNQQIEANALDLALCFAMPSIVIMWRYLEGREPHAPYYVLAGSVATGMTNLFVLVILLICLMLLVVFFQRGRLALRWLGGLVGVALLLVTPAMIHCLYHGIDPVDYFRSQFFATMTFSFYPNLIMDMAQLGLIYAISAAGTALLCFTGYYRTHSHFLRNVGVLACLFILASMPYIPEFNIGYNLVDVDQLNSFYAFLIAVFGGVLFHLITRTGQGLIRIVTHRMKNMSTGWSSIIRKIEWASVSLIMALLLVWQGGLHYSTLLPATLPNGFFAGYYRIIDELLPYTYATVGPELDRNLARNRHYFMNYDYLMNQYGSIDSLYQEYLMLPEAPDAPQTVPPASIFVFVEKPGSSQIQQGILYDAPLVMDRVTQWLERFRRLPNREVSLYYETESVAVYEIINSPTDARVSAILGRTRPDEEGR